MTLILAKWDEADYPTFMWDTKDPDTLIAQLLKNGYSWAGREQEEATDDQEV